MKKISILAFFSLVVFITITSCSSSPAEAEKAVPEVSTDYEPVLAAEAATTPAKVVTPPAPESFRTPFLIDSLATQTLTLSNGTKKEVFQVKDFEIEAGKYYKSSPTGFLQFSDEKWALYIEKGTTFREEEEGEGYFWGDFVHTGMLKVERQYGDISTVQDSVRAFIFYRPKK